MKTTLRSNQRKLELKNVHTFLCNIHFMWNYERKQCWRLTYSWAIDCQVSRQMKRQALAQNTTTAWAYMIYRNNLQHRKTISRLTPRNIASFLHIHYLFSSSCLLSMGGRTSQLHHGPLIARLLTSLGMVSIQQHGIAFIPDRLQK